MRLDEARYDTRHDVSELREKYRGRRDIYVIFTDDGELDFQGSTAGSQERPYGVFAWDVNDVISRKSTRIGGRYANVVRYLPDEILDYRKYNQMDFMEDIELLKLLDYVDPEEVDRGLDHGTIGKPFDRIMDITNRLTFGHALGDRLWRRILSDLGYTSIRDQDGRCIILDVEDLQELDIVQYETFRPENRSNVIRSISRKNWLTRSQRNRFSKVRELRQDLDYGEIEKNIISITGRL